MLRKPAAGGSNVPLTDAGRDEMFHAYMGALSRTQKRTLQASLRRLSDLPLTAPFSAVAAALRTEGDARLWRFGSARVATEGDERLVRNINELAVDWQQGEPGAAAGVITNSSMHQTGRFSTGQNHVFGADYLELRCTLNAGTFNTYLRGNIAGGGMVVNPPGGAAVTPNAQISIASTSAIEVGDVANNAGVGLVYVSGKAAGSVTVETVNCPPGTMTANFHVTFRKMAAVPVASAIENEVTTVVTLARALPSYVGVGWTVSGCERGATGGDATLASAGWAKIQSISTDRLTVTFDVPLYFPGYAVSPANNGILVFKPQVAGSEIWGKFELNPMATGSRVLAMKTRYRAPAFARTVPTELYTKGDFDAFEASYPDFPWGQWRCRGWTFHVLRALAGLPADVPVTQIFELDWGSERWGHPGMGTAGANFNGHDYSGLSPAARYARERLLAADLSGWAIPGSTWRTEAAGIGDKGTSPNASTLILPGTDFDNQWHSVETLIVWDESRDCLRVVHYLDGVPFAVDRWDAGYRNAAPWNLGLDFYIGAMQGYFPVMGFMPRSDSNITTAWDQISDIEVYTL